MKSSWTARTHSGKAVLIQLNGLINLGFESQELLKETNLIESKLEDVNHPCTLGQQNKFYRNALDLSQDPYLAIKMGQEFNAQKYGLFGYGLLSAKTIRHSLIFIASFDRLTFTYFDMYFQIKGKFAEFCFINPLPADQDIINFLCERDLMALKVALNEAIDDTLPITRIEFPHDASEHLEGYQSHYGCEVLFNQPTAKMVIESKHLERPLKNSDPAASDYLVQQCQLLIAKLDEDGQFIEKVRMLILAKPGYFPDIDYVAEKLNISSRTLRRHLTNEETSFREIMDETKNKLATDYLTQTNMSIADIGALLGYSEPGNFTHAFVRWNKISPSEYRLENKPLTE